LFIMLHYIIMYKLTTCTCWAAITVCHQRKAFLTRDSALDLRTFCNIKNIMKLTIIEAMVCKIKIYAFRLLNVYFILQRKV